jgi:hypothetical protein
MACRPGEATGRLSRLAPSDPREKNTRSQNEIAATGRAGIDRLSTRLIYSFVRGYDALNQVMTSSSPFIVGWDVGLIIDTLGRRVVQTSGGIVPGLHLNGLSPQGIDLLRMSCHEF